MKRLFVLALTPLFCMMLALLVAAQGARPSAALAEAPGPTPVVTHGVYDPPGSAGSLAASVLQPTTEVKAETGWQPAGLALHAGQRFTVTYLDGTWTVDYRSVPYVGPEGYSREWDEQLGRWCAVYPDAPYARLLGKIGEGPAFSVGRGGQFVADRAGALHFRINDGDECLGDNAGQVRVAASSGEVTLMSVTTTDEQDRAQTVFRAGELLGLKIAARNTTGAPADVTLSWRVYDPYGRLLPGLGLESYAAQAPPGDAWWGIGVVLPAVIPPGDYTYTGTLTFGGQTTSAATRFSVVGPRVRVFVPFAGGKR